MIQEHLASNGNPLYWDSDFGIGYLEANNTEPVYEIGYWENYQKLKDTKIGKDLTKARIALTEWAGATPDNTLDIGIGNGQFVEEFGCMGTDINPHAVTWLKSINKYSESYEYDWITMWDVIEHIEPNQLYENILSKNGKGIILSTPIYESFEDCISSKHYKPNEHILYFTVSGIITYMEQFDYKCIKMTWDETKVGRHNIGSFVFVKR